MLHRTISACLLALFAGFHSGAFAMAVAAASEPACKCAGMSGSCCCRRKAARNTDSAAWRAASCCGGHCRCGSAAPWQFRVAAPPSEAVAGPAPRFVPAIIVPAVARGHKATGYPAVLYQRPPPAGV